MRPSSGSIIKAASDSQSSSSPRPAPVEIDDRSACRCRSPGNPHTSDRMWRVGYQDCPAWPEMRLLHQLNDRFFLGRRISHASPSPIPVHAFLGDRFPSVRSATDFLWRRRLKTQIFHLARSCRTPRTPLARHTTSRRQCPRAGRALKIFSSPRHSFQDDSIFSSAEYCRCVLAPNVLRYLFRRRFARSGFLFHRCFWCLR